MWSQKHKVSFKDAFLNKLWIWIRDGLELKGYDVTKIWHRWQMPEPLTAHPKEDAAIMEINLEAGIATRSEYIRKRGGDPDEVFEERAREEKKINGQGSGENKRKQAKPNDAKPNDAKSSDGISKGDHQRTHIIQ